ncbi:MAG TPA: MlaD family protein [Gemmatimonadaceae bacterium]|jgi:phospholipid/cholesterol/gamma-HCH transport system substrate-binding protein|nr:MlaD family protein [Gemmatimonadaceae bacterium]
MRRRDEVIVGVFITFSLLVGIFGTLWLARKGFGKTYPLYARFAWGENLKAGQQVLLAGVQVGAVEDVRLKREGFLDVKLKIDKEYQVPEGSSATVVSVGFFGDKAVAIHPPAQFSASNVTPGDTLPAGRGGVSIDALLQRLDTVSRSVTDVAQSFEVQMVRQGGLADLREAIGNTNRLIAQLNDVAAEQSRGVSVTLASLRRTINAIDSATVDSTVRNMQDATQNLAELTATLSQTTATMNALVSRIDSGQGTAGKILRDEALYDDLRDVVTRVDSLLVDFKRNPRRYINLKVF